MQPTLVAGGYATAPVQGSRDDEIDFYSKLLSSTSSTTIGLGLEIPLFMNSTIHKNKDEDLILNSLISAGCPRSILTLVPGSMQNLAIDKHFGLASDDASGRLQAVNFVKQANEAVIRINKSLGRNAIVAVEVLSAPSRVEGVSSSASSLTISLIEISKFEWFGAEILLEHCDQGGLLSDVKPQKGFLSFTEELEAINAANAALSGSGNSTKIGVSINWARAVLETRDIQRPIQLIKSAGELLRCIIFSGCSAHPCPYGEYQDSHMPWDVTAEKSLLTRNIMTETLLAAKKTTSLLVCGVKVTLQPADATAEVRADVNIEMIKAIEDALK